MQKVIRNLVTIGMVWGLLAVIAVAKVKAAGGETCVPVYGGGVQCPRPGEVLINKTVRNPSTGVFVDNLGPSDPKYRPQWTVIFRIFVQNPGDQTLDNVVVTDTLPLYVDFMTGPAGSTYNSNNRTLTWTVGSLTGGSSQMFEVKARVVHPALLPADRNIICPIRENPQPVNVVEARLSDGRTDRDQAQFCIEKELEVPLVPKAGPENWLLSLAGLVAALGIGNHLRRKANELTTNN